MPIDYSSLPDTGGKAAPSAGSSPSPSSTISAQKGSVNYDSLPDSGESAPKTSTIEKGAVNYDSLPDLKARESPYWSGTLGDTTFGPSKTLDSSGKPLLDYRGTTDNATTTDKTRVDTTFDPSVPQKMDSNLFYNPRAVANRAALKAQMGGTYSTELDHKIALELSGSNQTENLGITPGSNISKAQPWLNTGDQMETSLAKQVANGGISLFDAQKQLADFKNKNQPGYMETPVTGNKINQPNGLQQFVKNGFDNTKNFLTGNIPETITNKDGTVIPNPEAITHDTIENLAENVIPATKDFATSAFRGVFNFFNELGNAVLSAGPKQLVERANGKPVILGGDLQDPEQEKYNADVKNYNDEIQKIKSKYGIGDVMNQGYSKEVVQGYNNAISNLKVPEAPGINPSKLAGSIVGGSIPYLLGGEVLAPFFEALGNSSPVVKFVGSALLNGGMAEAIQMLSPAQEGQTKTSQFLSNLPGDLLFGMTSQIPGKIAPALTTAATQFGLGTLKGDDIKSNIINSVTMGIFSLVDHNQKNTGNDVALSPIENIKNRAIEILNTDIGTGKDRNPQDVFIKAIAHEFLTSTPEEQQGFVEQAKSLVQKVIDKYNSIPNKKGGYINFGADLFGPEETPTEPTKPEETKTETDPLAVEAKKYNSAEEFVNTPNHNGIVPEYGTRNQYFTNNPALNENGGIGQEGNRWELNQVLKDKPAYFNQNSIPTPELKKFAKDNNLIYLKAELKDWPGEKEEIVAKTMADAEKVINAKNQRELGLALGYEDLGGPISKSQLTDIWNKAHTSDKANITTNPNLRTFDFNELEGKPQTDEENAKIHNQIINNPDKPMTPSGESFEGISISNDKINVQPLASKVKPNEGTFYNESRNVNEEMLKNGSSEKIKQYADRVGQVKTAIAFLQERLNNSAIKPLLKYARNGNLPNPSDYNKETSKSEWMKNADKIVPELGFETPADAIDAYNKYKDQQSRMAELKDELKKLDEYKSLIRDQETLNKFIAKAEDLSFADPEIAARNFNVVPPSVRGGIRSPDLDFTKWNKKEISLLSLNAESFYRNIERIAPRSDVEKIRDFLVDHVNENDKNSIKATKKSVGDMESKFKELGLNPNSKDSVFIHLLAEGKATAEFISENGENLPAIKNAIKYFRDNYDDYMDNRWNPERAKFGYKPIPKLPNYFRHMTDITWFTRFFGFLKSQNELPTSIVAETPYFKPGMPFSNATLKRMGNKTDYDAVHGFENYVKSVNNQIYHIDSVQRGKALLKYINEVALASEKAGQPLQLQNFKQNLNEYVYSGLAGKKSSLDRGIEGLIGRGWINRTQQLGSYIVRNIIAGNFAAALSHGVSIPLNAATTEKIPFAKGIMDTLSASIKEEDFNMIDGHESSYMVRRYPSKTIAPKWWDKADDTLNFMLNTIDKFKVRLAVSSKYYELTEKGMTPEDAIKKADEYAGRVIGDYSKGNKPNIFLNKSISFITPFQLGMKDGVSFLLHDIPYENTDPETGDKNKTAIISKYIQWAIFSYLLNLLYKKARGSGKGLDPIDWMMTLTGQNDEGRDETVLQRLESIGGDIAGELPFTNIFTGNFPMGQAVTNMKNDIVDIFSGKATAGLADIASTYASPIGGGTQLKKTISGLLAVGRGETQTTTGKTKAPIEQTPLNYIKGALFGTGAFEESQKYNNNYTFSQSLTKGKTSSSAELNNQAEKEYQVIKNMMTIDPTQAAAEFDKVIKDNPELAKAVNKIKAEDDAGINATDRLIKTHGITDGTRAQFITHIISQLSTPEEKFSYLQELYNKKLLGAQTSAFPYGQVYQQVIDSIGK